MYNVPEYISARRAASILKMHILEEIPFPHPPQGESFPIKRSDLLFDDQDELLFRYSVLLEEMILYVKPGSIVKKFLYVDKAKELYFTIFLAELFEPSHIYMPFCITKEHIYTISPFGVTRDGEKEYLMEFMPTSILSDIWPKAKLMELLECGLEYRDLDGETKEILVIEAIKDHLDYFIQANQESDQLVYESFHQVDPTFLREVSVDSKEFETLHTRYGFESILSFISESERKMMRTPEGTMLPHLKENSDSLLEITPTDFMPFMIERNGDSFMITIRTAIEDTKDGAYSIQRHFDLTKLQSGETPTDSVMIKLPLQEKGSILFFLDSPTYYLGNGMLGFKDSCDQINQTISLFTVYDEIGTEGVMSTLGDFYKICKFYGIKSGSFLYGLLMNLTKVPRSAIKEVWRSIKQAFSFRVKLEKDDAIDITEKVLNDDLDYGREKVKLFAQVGLRGAALAACCGTILVLPFVIAWQKSKAKVSKIRSIERAEFRLDADLEKIEYQLEAAKSEGDHKKVLELMSLRQTYEFSKMKLIEFKRDVVKQNRIRYRTFDKDTTMTTRQRLDVMANSGGYYNLHGEYGKDFVRDTD